MSLGSAAKINCTSPGPEGLIPALEKELFPKKLFGPVKSFSTTINITIYFTLISVLDVQWDIEDLSWDDDQCGTWRVAVPREGLWVPDITISEFFSTMENRSPVYPFTYLDNNGHVLDDQPLYVVSSCTLDIYFFPFDIQNCTLTFGSYLHFSNEIRMVLGKSGAEILQESNQVLQANREWELIDIIATHNSLEMWDGTYDQVIYYIVLKRFPMRYVVNLIIPRCFLIIVDLFSFLLPPENMDRSTFKITLLLGYTVFLIMANNLLPVTGDTTPIVNVFFSISLAMMVTSLLETVFITNIQYSSEPALVELRQLARDLKAIRTQIDKHFHGKENFSEWIHIGKVLDRLLFLLHVVFISVSFVTIICVWNSWGQLLQSNN